ncbi:ABC transporter ATP-binding protein [Acrocarpospora catenulata]|uniref:ABC transporter ATP-binding protein n=1 Tax=Acrocarpospora catenulata TaxID=2836182 RepID=UPI0027DEE338|nr:ABC transporter ATP-binding protein [Acrocarpospora catenulata]
MQLRHQGADPALTLTDIHFSVGAARILTAVTLDLTRGETLCVIGPNGAGKTTLMNVITGTVTPQQGRVHLNGVDITRMASHLRTRHGMARTFQTSYLFDKLTVLDNVVLAARGSGRGPRGRKAGVSEAAAAHDALGHVGLAPRAQRPVGALSHGERRKVEIAMALVSGAEVLLLDEPMAGVSAEDVPDLVALIKNYVAAQDRSIVLVEHHMDVVLELADRVAVLHHGEVLAVGTPDEVMANEQVQTAYMGEEL